MSLDLSLDRPIFRRAAVGARLAWLPDALALPALFIVLAAAVVWRFDVVPLQLWDESRNANNALELVLAHQSGWGWLAPTFGGRPDHWNTKPPFLIWLMAAGLRAGLPPLLALRLPSWTAAFGTVAAVWSGLRFGLGDRLAAFAGGALVASSTLYVGAHAARTGDYDALEALFVTGYVLCGWAALREAHPDARSPEGSRWRWAAAAAACAALAVLTKGVAGLLAAPGLLLFALARSRILGALVRDGRVWAAGVALAAVCVGYYALRERVDSGYVAAVLANEVGGRFLAVSDHHRGGPAFYLQVLAAGFGPGLAILPAALLPLRGPDRRRRGLVLASGLSALALLAVLSTARSKLDWYAVPAVPLLAVPAAVGLGDLRRRVREGAGSFAGALDAILAVALACACTRAIAVNQTARTTSHGSLDGPQFGYAALFDRVEAARLARSVVAEDEGFANAAGFTAYNPVLQFYARRETARGMAVAVRPVHTPLAAGTQVATCDPWAMQAMRDDFDLAPELQLRGCILARVMGRAGEGRVQASTPNRPAP